MQGELVTFKQKIKFVADIGELKFILTFWMKPAALGMQHLHKENVIHRVIILY